MPVYVCVYKHTCIHAHKLVTIKYAPKSLRTICL